MLGLTKKQKKLYVKLLDERLERLDTEYKNKRDRIKETKQKYQK